MDSEPRPRSVDDYFAHATQWPQELAVLRPLLLEAGLGEVLKWGKPCYTHAGRNVAILQEMRPHLALMFFQGAALPDPDGVLEQQGPNSRLARRIPFTSVEGVRRLEPTVSAYLRAAMRVAEGPRPVIPAAAPELPAELRRRLHADPALQAAFEALTPGRRREYQLHIAEAKRPETRDRRVTRCIPAILAGRGLRDR